MGLTCARSPDAHAFYPASFAEDCRNVFDIHAPRLLKTLGDTVKKV